MASGPCISRPPSLSHCRENQGRCCNQTPQGPGWEFTRLSWVGVGWASVGGAEAELSRLSPFLFLIGTLMRAEGADPLPGGQFMPRLSHSSRQTRTTLQASGRPGAPALSDGLSDRSELAAEVCGGCTVLSACNKGAGLALLTSCSSRGWARMTSSSLRGAEFPPPAAPFAGETVLRSRGGAWLWGILDLQGELVQETSSSLAPSFWVQDWVRFSANTLHPDYAGPFTCCAILSESDNLSGPESPRL